jgi:two-component system, cell cycle response regulator
MRVLVADDEPVSRRMLERSLRRWGYEVVVAHDGFQALEVLDQPNPPKLLVLDWLMPGKDGVELCRDIRKRCGEDYSYVLLLTSKRAQNDVIEGLESGADDYLTKPFDPQELQVRLRTGQRIINLMDQLVAAREALREMAMRDALTGLWNRAAIIESLDVELGRSRREGTSVGILMVDIDHFKSINDTFGHPAGDAALREVAQTMKDVIRAYDFAGRYGGEEFLIVLPGCNELTAVSQAERIRKAIGQLVVKTERGEVKCTASFGVAIAHGPSDLCGDHLIKIADEALYSAKRGGRNRVALAQPGRAPLDIDGSSSLTPCEA